MELTDFDLPEWMWISHTGRTHRLAWCSLAHPYSTVMLIHLGQGRGPEDDVEPVTITTVDDTQIVIHGSGLSEDKALYSAQLEHLPLPVCRCADIDLDIDDPTGPPELAP